MDTAIKIIDKVGFYNQQGNQRWSHTAMSKSEWDNLNRTSKEQVVRKMYRNEGGNSLL